MQVTDGISLAMQEARITQWADINSYTLTGIFRDEGISGMKEDRKGLADALASLTQRGRVVRLLPGTVWAFGQPRAEIGETI
jgi:hypothetical protein